MAAGYPRINRSAPAMLRGNLITTDEIYSDNERLRKYYSNVALKTKILKFRDQQRTKEEYHLKRGTTCPVNKLKNLRDRLGNLDSPEFKSIIRNEFYNPDVMKAAMCATESITYIPRSDPGNVASNLRVKRWLHNLHRIGAESVEGFAMQSDLGKADDTFVIKAPRDPENPTLLHEYFVGVFGLNQLRKRVPNFAYIMGGFRCSLPVIDEKKKVIAWCNNNNHPIDYVIYENITPGKTLSETITGPVINKKNRKGEREYDVSKGCTFTEWLTYYLQIILALDAAQTTNDGKPLGFTHYDLHTENVIIWEVPQGKDGNRFAIPYTINGKKINVLSDKVAIVIDYGLAHIEYKGEHYGVADRVPWGVQPNASFPMHDAYKLLMMSMRDMYASKRDKMLKKTAYILDFFNKTDSIENIILDQRKTYYYLPYNTKTTNLTFGDLVKHIEKSYDLSPIVTEKIEKGRMLLSCRGNDFCLRSSQFMSKTKLNMRPQAKTAFDFYDIGSRLEDERDKVDFELLREKFDYKTAIKRAVNNYNFTVKKFDSLVDGEPSEGIYALAIQQITSPGSNENSLNSLFSSRYLKLYKNYIYRITEIYETMQDATVLYNAILYTAKSFNDDKYADSIEAAYNKLWEKFSKYWNQILKFIERDLMYLDDLTANSIYKEQIDDKVARDSRFLWWWRSFPDIVDILTQEIE